MLHRAVTLLLVAAAVGCGGATELKGQADGSGGSDSGGSGSTGGDGSGGATSGGNTSSTSVSTSATATNGVTSTTGDICIGLDCAFPACPDGELIVPPAECCPVCSCSLVECEPLNCPSDRTVTPAGACCPVCADAGCEGVVCEGPTECDAGYVFSRPDGACCGSCVPGPEGVLCPDIPCPPEPSCALGYIAGQAVGACCSQCLPDPLYCADSRDCVLADRPRSCCGCPEVISTRALDDDPCWSPVGMPRDIPEECYPDAICDAFCGACPDPGEAVCQNNRCVQIVPQ